MKKFKFLAIAAIFITIFSFPLSAFAQEDYKAEAGAAILIDMVTGDVLFEQAADEKMYPASLTKVMTCLIAAEVGDLNAEVTASETAYLDLIDAGSTAGILPGETMTLENLLYCAMLPSANEACNIIAEYISGSTADFVKLMNEKAAAMGCTGTNFVNCHGLHDENHYTTARDMAIIGRAAFSNDIIRTVAGTAAYTVPATNLSEPRDLESTDQLISDSINANYLYPYAIAGKTGYTTPAGRCLVSCAFKDDKELLSVVLKTDSIPPEDGSVRVMSFYETIRLFNYGFENWSYQTVIADGTPITEVPVKLGEGADSVVLCISGEVTYLLPASFDIEATRKVITVFNQDNITAPITKGQELGLYEVYDENGVLLGSAPLTALVDIERSVPEAVVDGIRETARKPVIKAVVIVVVILVVIVILGIMVRRQAAKRRAQQEKNRRRGQELRRRQEEYSGKK